MKDLLGRWRITQMETWDQDYVDLVEPGAFEFERGGQGQFVFGTVSGWLDVRVSAKERLVEFSWQGQSDGDDACGRGWFKFPTANRGEGKLFIHGSDDSGVTIERET